MKLGILSNERLNPWISWSQLGPPLLGPLAQFPNSVFIAPPPLSIGKMSDWWSVFSTVQNLDTLFWMQFSARPELPLSMASLLGGRKRRCAYVIDAWKGSLNKIGLLAIAQSLDPCFVAYREACDQLQRRFPKGKFEWLPFGCDTEVFKPSLNKKF
jgi:hypothetical protein